MSGRSVAFMKGMCRPIYAPYNIPMYRPVPRSYHAHGQFDSSHSKCMYWMTAKHSNNHVSHHCFVAWSKTTAGKKMISRCWQDLGWCQLLYQAPHIAKSLKCLFRVHTVCMYVWDPFRNTPTADRRTKFYWILLILNHHNLIFYLAIGR